MLNAPIGASKLQDDVGGQDATSAQQRTTVPDVSLIPRQIATGNQAEERHAELDHGLEIMRHFNLKYIVRMCSPQLVQLRRECGFKMVKMRKPDLMESMILQLYDQTPIQATAPKHAEAKGHRHEPLQTRARNAFSRLTSMKETTENMDRYQKNDIGNTHGMNGDFMKTNCRLYVQGQT
jgi:hypothetical protein